MVEQLRHLPSVDDVLQYESVAELRRQFGHSNVRDWIRSGIDSIRQRLLTGQSIDPAELFQAVVHEVFSRQQQDHGHQIRRVLNATGVILHTNLGRSPLARLAIDRMHSAAHYANVELNLDTGQRSSRGQRVCGMLARLTGAERALVVNNCAAATMLVLQTVASGAEVIVSRGQLVEIGGGFRLPDVFRAAGVTLREVGTTNRTYLRDYESAISGNTAAVIRVHRSNFYQGGFVTEPSIGELASLDLPPEIPVIDDLGSGCLSDLSKFGVDEPVVADSVRAGADLTLFSGDKLFGGPQAGIVVGRRNWIERLCQSPMMRAMRVDKLTLAALEATTEIHLTGDANHNIPILKMITAPASEVQRRAESVRTQLEPLLPVDVVTCESQVGGGSAPGSSLPSFAVRLTTAHPDRLADRLRRQSPAVHGRVVAGGLQLDLRTIAEDETELLIDQLRRALRQTDETA